MMLFSQYEQQLLLTAKKRIEEGKYSSENGVIDDNTITFKIDYDQKKITREETMVSNPFCYRQHQSAQCKGYRYTYHIPVQGKIDVLKYQSLSAHSMPLYEGEFDIDHNNGNIMFVYYIAAIELPNTSEEQAKFIQKKIDGDIAILRNIEKALLQDIAQYNIYAERELSQYYQEYQKRQAAMVQTDQILGIDVVMRPEKQTINNATTIDKPNKKQFPDFSDVTKIIYDNGTAMERDVQGFQAQNEAELRSNFLTTLKTHGIDAFAETVNRGGKTDIYIKKGNDTHIVECKVWSGPDTTGATLEQLLDYCTWYDSTGTIVLFNRKNKKFCDLLSIISSDLSVRQEFQQLHQNAWSFVDTSDGNKLITVYCFDLCDKGYSSKEKNKKTKENRL